MRVNDKDFPLYNIDTEDVIIQRIASLFDTTPFWLHVEGDLTDDNENLRAENILDTLKADIKNENVESFNELQEKLKSWLDSRDDPSSVEKLAEMYTIIYFDENKNLGLDRRFMTIQLENFFSSVFETEFTYEDIDRTLDNYEIIKLRLENEISQNKFRVRKIETSVRGQKKFYEENDDEDDNDDEDNEAPKKLKYDHTPPAVHSLVTKFVVKFNHPIVLRHIFNQINFKQYSSFDNFEPMFCCYDRLFKINCRLKKYIPNYNFDYEHDVLSIVFVKLVKNVPTFRDVVIKMSNLEPELHVCEVCADIESDLTFDEHFIFFLFPENFSGEILSKQVVNIKCSFNILQTSYTKELFLDCVMNNPKFFSLVANERQKFSKFFNKMRLYYIGRNFVPFAVVLTNVVQNVEVKINKAPSFDVLNKFVAHFMTLFTAYKTEEAKLYKYYKKYTILTKPTLFNALDEENDDDDEIRQRTGINKESANDARLKRTVPQLFVSQYSRRCAHRPRIVDKNDVPDGVLSIEFPLYNEGGLKPLTYICDRDDGYVFPGLRKNKLGNNDVFKYIPCCYETNQSTRQMSGLNEYLSQNDEEDTEKQKYDKTSFRTHRIATHNGMGNVPVNIYKFFGVNKSRIGVYKGPNSFIDCVSRSTKKHLDFLDQPLKREEYLCKLRENFDYRLCIQENSDLSVASVKSWLKDTTLYLEPHRFFRCLEEFFSCNIYIFERSPDRVIDFKDGEKEFVWKKTNSPSGVLQIPNVPQIGVYADSKRFSKSVCVYVHMGASTNLLKYPHCEYIELEKSEYNDVEKLYRTLLVISETHAINGETTLTQYLDNFGRVYGIKTISDEEIILKIPVAPISGPELKLSKNDDHYNLECDKSYMMQNVFFKQLARILLEYCMIKYVASELDSVREFADEYLVASADQFTIPLNFENKYEVDDYDKIFSKNQKIFVDSQDTVDRLIYNMQKLEKRNGKKMYRGRRVITSYFESLLDYNPIVINEDTFKLNYEPQNGLFMNNELFDVEDANIVAYKDVNRTELNGIYQIYSSIDEMITETMLADIETMGNDGDPDGFFIWNSTKFEEMWSRTNSRGRTVIIFSANDSTKVMIKISNIQ